MRSTFGSLNTATRALVAQQVAVGTASHNVANANTPGFSRQDAVLTTTDPFTVPAFNRSPAAGQLGTGVNVASVRRLRDTFLDAQIRYQTARLGEQQVQRDTLEQIEVVFNEPSDTGLSAMMSRFFNAWQAVVNKPEDQAVRMALVTEAANFAATIRRSDGQLTQIRADVNQQIQLKAAEVNSLAGRIAALNAQIGQIEGAGQQPNDLRDQRDLLVDQLSRLVHVSQAENANGSINLFVGSRALVLGNDALLMTTGPNAAGDTTVRWAGDGSAVTLVSGELQGLSTVRDTTLAQQAADLDTLAAGLIGQVNAIHATGYGLTDPAGPPPGRLFFTGGDATTIAVNSALSADPSLVAAAAGAGQPGDNTRALAIAQLRDALTMAGGTATFHSYYQSSTAGLGTAARAAATSAGNQRAMIDLLTARKESVAGVNLDEEATNLIKYQHAYQAAARVITTVDDMLDRIINRMGRSGL